MPEIDSITYEPCDPPKVLDDGRGFALFGGYRVSYDDDFQVFIPHAGYIGTVSATPLDPDDDEHRQVIADSAERMRLEHDVTRDIEDL